MNDFERQPRWRAEEDEASGIGKDLFERSERGDPEIYLGFPAYVEEQLTSAWMADGYSRLMMFVDRAAKPIAVARLDEGLMDKEGMVRQGSDVTYRLFIDDETREVVVPHELAGGMVAQQLHAGDYVFYDATDEIAVMEALLRDTDGKMAASLVWLEERFGKKLAAIFSTVAPYLANEDSVLAVRFDAIPPNFEGDSSRNPARF